MKSKNSIGLKMLYALFLLGSGFVCGCIFRMMFFQEKSPIIEEVRREPVVKAMITEEHLNADTIYLVKENDLLKGTTIETQRELPAQYLGLTREQFETCIKQYAENPPLSEVKRGFVGLEMVSFAPECVTVEMNYRCVKPDSLFYLVIRDHEVLVLLEDGETIYMHTGIKADELPEEIVLRLLQILPVEGEEKLYHILESYSS